MNEIFQVVDSTENRITNYIQKNSDWPFERLVFEFKKSIEARDGRIYGADLRGRFYEFKKFIEARGATEITIPSIDIPSYPDIEYD